MKVLCISIGLIKLTIVFHAATNWGAYGVGNIDAAMGVIGMRRIVSQIISCFFNPLLDGNRIAPQIFNQQCRKTSYVRSGHTRPSNS